MDEHSENYLAHYGVIGMKWGVRHDPQKAYEKSKKKLTKINNKINKYDTKAKKQFNKGVNKSGGFFASQKKADKAFAKSRKMSRKALRMTAKGDKWIKRMQKEFANQSVVSLEPSIINLGEKYSNRLLAAADNMYVNSF